MKKLIFILLLTSVGLFAADLPEKGIEPPTVVNAGPQPPNPGIPVGNGFVVVAVFAIGYVLKRKMK